MNFPPPYRNSRISKAIRTTNNQNDMEQSPNNSSRRRIHFCNLCISIIICLHLQLGQRITDATAGTATTTNSSLFTRFDRDAYLAARGGKPGGDCGAVQPLTNDDARIGTKTTENYDYDDPNNPPYMWMGRQCNDETYSYSQTQHDVPYNKETCRG